MTNSVMVEALKEARQFLLAPAEDLLWGVVHRIDAALATHTTTEDDLRKLEQLELPVVGKLFVARGAATLRGYRGIENGPDENSDLVRLSDVTAALQPICAALAAPVDHPEVVGVTWGDSGPISGQSFGDEFDAQPQPASPVAAAPSKEPVAWQETPPDIVQAARMAADTVGVTPYSVMRVHVEHAVRYALLVERASPAVAPVASVPTDAQIKHMVDRFLMWRLPENFRPDAGISFKADFNENTAWPMKHKPVGTNLFDAAQADAMVRNMVEGMPSSHHPMKLGIQAIPAAREASR
ncbi:hypothetical protein [Mesorhizobium sp. M0139]|uniref:hypothetical protein n=1 Tax=Mesorhizobium sp. M0139 TaxID=2956892 RepID=UPI0033352F0D